MWKTLLLGAILLCCYPVIESNPKQSGSNGCPRTNNVRFCGKTCSTDGDCKGNRKCLCDGDCGMICVKNNLRCENLPKVKNGRSSFSNTSYFRSVVTYKCKKPYKLRGSETRTCRATGKWDGGKTRCKPFCQDPGEIRYGNRRTVRNKGVKYIHFWCYDEDMYKMVGTPRIRCQENGQWSAPKPKCILPSCDKPNIPDEAAVIYPRSMDREFKYGDKVLLKCKEGYFKSGLGVYQCKKGNIWSGGITCSPKSCGRPNDIPNGKIIGYVYSFKEKIRYECNEGYNLKGPSYRTCQANEKWGDKDPICEVADCGPLRKPDHGDIIEQVAFTYGNRIVFECTDTGYEMKGSRVRTCQSDGTWSGSPTTCEIVQCGDPGTPTNGKQIVNKGFEYGGSVEFKCYKNYTLEGTRIIYCRANKLWSASVPHCRASCKDPGNPLNGRKVNHDFRHKKTVSFTCQKNYALEGARTITCSNGQWSAKRPLCLALCPAPIAPTNGRIQGKDFRHGRSIKFWCSRGYTRVGAFSVTCKEGKWGAPFPVCKASCARPSIPANGRIVGNIFSHGKSVWFYCSFGYTRVGAGSIKCDDGKWDKPFPVCKGICPTPSAPRNGKLGQKVSLDKRFLDGDEATFSCNRGYDLIGKKRLRCVGKVWDFGEPECKAPCNPPGFPANGKGKWRDLKHNSWVTFSCDKKYQLEGRRQMQCKDGIWSGNRPKCVAVCPDPGEPLRGKRRGNNFRNGSIITFTCNTDHELIGNNTIRCEDGVWSGSVPLCKGKCKFQGSPKNGYTTNRIFLNGKLFSHGSNVEYACDVKYTMDGTNILHCNDGFWNASIPLCKATCTEPGLIDRGKRNGTDFSHGQVVTYECSSKNYSLVGNPRLTCNDGVWDSALPVCKKSCKPLPLLSNGKIHNNGVSHGAVVSFSCNSGFQPQGSLQIKCLDGIWNESSPSCIGVCAKPGKLRNGTVVGSNYSYGSVIKFKCNKGYKLRGSAKLKCRRGVWEGQFPECEVCVRVGAVFWGFWQNNMKADNYWKASITRITATHFDFALVNNNKQTRSYRRTDRKLIIDKVPSIGDLLPSSPVIAHQFGNLGWYRTGKVNNTSGDSLVKVQFDDGGKKWVKLGRVRLVSYPDFCSDVE
ncbi:unnamed protein product [Pocillopora meandrina]|uniref:Uncharacterized protein n=1 Tax=Pocillopora meandrina TaxID=46732 RepID=A0AAU9VRA9_9CNID|nr:unnamed protein product [Pocillopora meandrina]